jgi:hypothetical protein
VVSIQKITIVLLVVAIGIWVGLHYGPSAERSVKRPFHSLAKWVSKEPGETTFAMARKTQSLGKLFVENCGFKASIISFSGHYSPAEISSYAAQARLHFSQLSLKFHDFEIEFPEKETATVTVTARVRGTSRDGEPMDEVQELHCLLKKTEGEWLFTDCEVVEVLEP